MLLTYRSVSKMILSTRKVNKTIVQVTIHEFMCIKLLSVCVCTHTVHWTIFMVVCVWVYIFKWYECWTCSAFIRLFDDQPHASRCMFYQLFLACCAVFYFLSLFICSVSHTHTRTRTIVFIAIIFKYMRCGQTRDYPWVKCCGWERERGKWAAHYSIRLFCVCGFFYLITFFSRFLFSALLCCGSAVCMCEYNAIWPYYGTIWNS